MTKKDKIARIIRVLSIPPIMVSVLVIILAYVKPEVFRNLSEILITIFLLGVVPILAYPLQKMITELKKRGREAQRNLAFVLNILGYTIAFIWVIVINASIQLKLICSTYFMTVLLLTVCNKLIHFRASGHASSFTGPLILLVYLVGLKTVVPCLLAALLIVWASVFLKRHTLKEISGGIAVCIVSFAISLLIFT